MRQLFLGVDAGATKTHALLLDGQCAAVGFGEAGSGSHEVVGYDRARESIAECVERALRSGRTTKEAVGYACYCLAGADVASDFEEIPPRLIEPVTGSIPHLLKNDSFGCLRGGTRDPYGVMVNCGTGQVAVGRNREGREIRLGGYGFEYGDLTGGGVITYQAVTAVVRAYDGRGEPTALVDLIFDASGTKTVPDFIDRTYRNEELVMSLGIAPLVFKASRAGDRVARRIVLDAAREMAVTATTLIRRLEMQSDEFDVVAAGSVFKGEDPVFMETIEREVHSVAPRARLRTPLYSPVVGAALLALEAAGATATDEMYGRLEETLPGELK